MAAGVEGTGVPVHLELLEDATPSPARTPTPEPTPTTEPTRRPSRHDGGNGTDGSQPSGSG
jgi:hypothetical protein